MRRLTLHASALNDEEYDLYTSSIIDLALCDSNKTDTRDDTFYEEIRVGVREVRAWLRGRYPDIQVNNIDAILKLFSPTLSHADTLSGGQFFAVLRLVLHVQCGKDVDRTLAFVQAHPKSSTNSLSTDRLTSQIPPRLARRSEESYASSVISEPTPPSTNPFSYDSGQQPPLHPSQRQEPSKTTHSPNNPFVIRSKSVSSKSEDGSNRLPPLPPRKPSVPIPPPRHAAVSSPLPTRLQQPSSTNNLRTTSPSTTPQPHSHPHPPPPPPKPKPVTHITSTLMQRSLQASKAAQTMKKAEEELGKERVLQVLRSSAVVSGARSFAGASISRSSIVIGSNMRNQGSGSRSPSKGVPVSRSVVTKSDSSSASWSGEEERERPPLPRRRPQQQPSPPMSTSSLEQVALAVAPSGTRSQPPTPYAPSPFESPSQSPRTRPTLDLPGVAGLPPPTHPNRKPYGGLVPSINSDEHSRSPSSSSTSPFRRNLESFEAVYGSNQPSPATSSISMETPTTPTPTSDTLFSGSPQQRMFRSKSLHHHKPPAPPPPPPVRRKRPESIQVLSNGEVIFGKKSPSDDSNNALKNSITQAPLPHRRSSYSSSFGGTSTTMNTTSSPSTLNTTNLGGGGNAGGADTIHRKLVELQLRAENALPKLEAARYKAEAGLSRRGFIQGSSGSSSSHGNERQRRSQSRPGGSTKEDREGLMSGYTDDQYCGGSDDGEGDGVYDDDDEGRGLSVDSGDEDCMRGRREGRRVVMERDELKWPVGEGWKML